MFTKEEVLFIVENMRALQITARNADVSQNQIDNLILVTQEIINKLKQKSKKCCDNFLCFLNSVKNSNPVQNQDIKVEESLLYGKEIVYCPFCGDFLNKDD